MKFSEYLRLDEGNAEEAFEKAGITGSGHPEGGDPGDTDLKVGEHSQEVADRTMSPEEQKKMASERKDWRAKLRPTGKPLKDWQIPSLKEDWRQTDPGYTRENEEEEPSESTPVITNPAHPNYKANDPHNVRRRNNSRELADRKKKEEVQNRMKERESREARLSDTIAHSEAKRKANESVEIPARDPLGRLSIQSMQEASTPKPLRKALKKANMGKKLSNKESGRVMRNTKADMSTRTNAAENYKNPQDDIDANDAAEADRRENAAGMDRQSHLDK